MPKFIIKQGAQPGREIPLKGTQLVFGRTEECDVLISDANLSRKHAQAIMVDGVVALVDLDSSNGTFVNDLPISRTFLMDGDEVRIGGTILVYSEQQNAGEEFSGVANLSLYRAPDSGTDKTGEQAGRELDRTQLFTPLAEDAKAEALKEIYQKLKTLYRVFHEVAHVSNLKDIFEAVGRGIIISGGAERAVFFLNAEKSGQQWQRYYAHTSSKLDPKAAALPESQEVMAQARETLKPVHARFDDGGRVHVGETDPNIIAFPLLRSGKLVALIYADNPVSRESFTKNDSDFIATLGLQIAIRLNQFEQVNQLKDENVRLRQKVDEDFSVVVQDEKMKQIMAVTARVAESEATVLVTGESGTGKELIAKSIHNFSRRNSKPLIAVNCAALPETLLESELFGHEKGSFTGAVERRVGKFELADGGSLFLDEIGDISAAAQAKLLRVLQEGEITRVGGSKVIKVNVRVIAATNKNLADEVRSGKFRQDLFYRLKVIEIGLPALRDRKNDVPVLAEYFLKQLRHKFPTTVKTIAPQTIEALMKYSFPGNVRELKNIIERGLVFAFGDAMLPEHLPMEVFQDMTFTQEGQPIAAADAPDGTPLSLADVERNHIQHVLRYVKGNKLKAAGLLGISRTTLYEKLKTYGLSAAD